MVISATLGYNNPQFDLKQKGTDRLMTDQKQEPQSIGSIITDAFKELGETLVAFVKAPKALLWGINVPYVLEGLVYFGILTILGKFCSENVGLSDLHAGWVYSGVTAGITLAMLFLGGVSDKIGVRRALALAFLMFVVGRVMIAFSGTVPLGQGASSPMFFTMVGGLFLMVVAYGLYQPAAYAGVKRYTTPKTAAMGYAVIYGLMNLGAFFSGLISPRLRNMFEDTFPPNGLTSVFWVYAGISLTALALTLLILTRKTDESAVTRIAEENEAIKQEEEKTNPTDPAAEKAIAPKAALPFTNLPLALLAAATTAFLILGVMIHQDRLPMLTTNTQIWGLNAFAAAAYVLGLAMLIATLAEFLRHRPDHPFRDVRFTFFIFILIPVQTLFAHNWLTIPYYLDRAFAGGFVSENFEFFSNINPLMIFVLTPIVAGLTARANVYRMMIYGTLVMAVPTFLLAIGPNVYLFLTYILLMSIGESMWQPRFLQWIAEIAPEGKTGLYMGIGQFPWFLTKMLTGLYSGAFVARYLPCPDTGMPIESGKLWLIYAFIAMVTPIALILARKWMLTGMREAKS